MSTPDGVTGGAEAGAQQHPGLAKGFNGGMPEGFWQKLTDVWFFFEDNGWPILITVVLLVVLWPHIEGYVRQALYNITAPPAVQVDHAAVERARMQQQERLLAASRARKEAEDARRREAALAQQEARSNKVGRASDGDAPPPQPPRTAPSGAAKKKKPRAEPADLGFMGRGGGGNGSGSTYWGGGGGGGGGGFRPSRRRPPGGGG